MRVMTQSNVFSSVATHVATLLCDPSFPALADRHLARAGEALDAPQQPIWLDKGIAADLCFASAHDTDCAAVTAKLRAAIADPQIDIIVQPLAGRRKKLLFIEMDKGLLGQDTCDEIAAVIGCAGELAEIRAKVANGEVDFATGVKLFFALLQGRGTDCLSQVLGKRMKMTPGAVALIETTRANGGTITLATYGFSCFAGPVAQKTNIQDVTANKLIIEGNKIAALAEPVLDPAGKAAILDTLIAAQTIARADVLVLAYAAVDLPLLQSVGTGIAFHAADGVADAASIRIDRGDLSAALYIQGYAKEDFVTEPRRPLDASDWKRKYGGYEKAHERTRL
jgi:phosphoserine phosphatase